MDLLLYGLATEHLSRVITKDSVSAVLRAPFTRFTEAAGEGEVNEDVVGQGFRHAVGELLTCPFCAAQWVATGLVAGSVVSPVLTTAVISVSAAARASDYLNLLYGLLRNEQWPDGTRNSLSLTRGGRGVRRVTTARVLAYDADFVG
jgi:hypothetical protein